MGVYTIGFTPTGNRYYGMGRGVLSEQPVHLTLDYSHFPSTAAPRPSRDF